MIRVRSDGGVRVTIPRWGTIREARAFAESQHAWIDKERRRLDEAQARTDRAPFLSPEAERQARRDARIELPARLHALAAKHGLSVARVSIRNQRWRWGSCSPNGHISLNWRLVRMPDWVSDYVIIHELMHLRRMDHSRKFWKLVAAACPDYERARQWLRANQLCL